ncbi:hypothetical protein ES703_94329 [subsurface metagenome]
MPPVPLLTSAKLSPKYTSCESAVEPDVQIRRAHVSRIIAPLAGLGLDASAGNRVKSEVINAKSSKFVQLAISKLTFTMPSPGGATKPKNVSRE